MAQECARPAQRTAMRRARKVRHCPACGVLFSTKARSPKHHRHFFAVVSKAFQNWPETYAQFQPDDPDHLRAWLLVRAGHRDVIHDSPTRPRAEFITEVIRRTRESGYAFPAEHSHALAVAFPRSMNWDTLDQSEFSPIAQKVYDMIESILGVKIEDIKDQCASGPHEGRIKAGR